MKKIYFFKSALAGAFALLANVAAGQSLFVTSNGVEVSNNDVIEVPYVLEDYSMPEMGFYAYQYKWDPCLEVATEEDSANLTVTVTSLNNTDGFQICWPQQCRQIMPGESVTSSGNIDPEPSNLEIHKEITLVESGAKPTEGGEVRVTLESGDEVLELTIKCLLSDTNGVGENLAESNEATSYYTLDGIKVENPTQKGMYIMRKGGNAKVFLKK